MSAEQMVLVWMFSSLGAICRQVKSAHRKPTQVRSEVGSFVWAFLTILYSDCFMLAPFERAMSY